jgi:hypothetical protein
VNKAKLTPTDRNNATDEKLLSVALFLSVGKTCSVCKDFLVSKSQTFSEGKTIWGKTIQTEQVLPTD